MTQDALTSESIDNFFESGGEVAPELEATEEQGVEQSTSDDTNNSEPEVVEEQKETTESEIDRNLRAALTEERERRKELQRERQELQAEKQKMEAAFQRFLESQQPTPQVPNFDDDPLEATRHQLQYTQQEIQNLKELEYQRQQQAEYQYRQNEFANRYQASAYEFAKQKPDFQQAYNYLMQNRLNEHMTAGYTQEQANRLLIEDELAIASKAFQDEVNPAERIYKLAAMRGYQSNAQPTGEKINQIQRTVSASKSLGSASGKTSRGFSLEALANLSKDELDEVISKDWDKIARAMS